MCKKISILLFLLGGLFVMGNAQTVKKAWVVPEKYEKMKNPQKADDAEMIKMGKSSYAKYCKSCHGATGLGNGVSAKSLETFPGDFSSAEFQQQKDGVIYYQSIVGRDEMPNFEKKILDEEERWAIVTYIRTLKK